MSEEELEPHPDVLLHIEGPDELLTHYLSLARASGVVYSVAVKQLLSRIYRDHDYIKRKQIEGKPFAYGDLLREDLQAMAWMIKATQVYIPEDVRRRVAPPRPPRPRKTQKQTRQALKTQKEEQQRRDIRYQSGQSENEVM